MVDPPTNADYFYIILHAPTKETLELFKITGADFKLMLTFVELLGSGGVNTTSIDVATKEAWHSRHAMLLSQYTGTCETDIF